MNQVEDRVKETEGHGATWYEATRAEAPDRKALGYDLDVDVCVVGGGLAGLTIAREVARRGWSVAVLEAGEIASGASGRNGGLVAPGFAERLPRVVDRVGLDRARALLALSLQGVDYISRTIRETGMPGVEVVPGFLSLARSDARERITRRAATLADEFGLEVEVWSAEQVREAVRSEAYYQGLYFPGAFHIHPLNYALGLAADAEAAGARIFERTPALALDPAGVRKRIDTPSARVRAGHVVLAGGAQLGRVFRYASSTVIALGSYGAVTAPLGARLLDAVRFTGAISEARRTRNFIRIVGGDRLMWTCGLSLRLSTPRRLAGKMQREIGRVFPQLGPLQIAHAWSGPLAYAVHSMPQVGEIAPGVWLAGAFGGHGLNTTAMAGELIARAIVENDDRWRLFSAYELVWAGGLLGRLAAQAGYWALRCAEDAAEWRARRRELAARRRLEKGEKLATEAARRTELAAARAAAEENARIAAERAQARREEEAAFAPLGVSGGEVRARIDQPERA